MQSAVALVDKSYYATLQPFSDPYTTLPIELKRQTLLLTIYSNTWFQHSAMTFFLNDTTPSKI